MVAIAVAETMGPRKKLIGALFCLTNKDKENLIYAKFCILCGKPLGKQEKCRKIHFRTRWDHKKMILTCHVCFFILR